MNLSLRVRAWSAWAPGAAGREEWADWARGGRELVRAGDHPPLAHLDGMFKRRLSQLSRMALQVGHDAAAGMDGLRVVFASQYGEINQQLKISRSLIAEGEVAPAAFSLSVFNTPAALLSIAERNHGYASALYGGPDSFGVAFLECLGLIAAEPGAPVLLLVGDELLPPDYAPLVPGGNQPYALALLLAGGGDGEGLELELESPGDGRWAEDGAPPPALAFLAWWLRGEAELRLAARDFAWRFRRARP